MKNINVTAPKQVRDFWMAIVGILLLVIGSLLVALPTIAEAQGGSSVFITPSKDNTLYESTAGDISNGAGQHLFAGRVMGRNTGVRRALVHFDVASMVPSGSSVMTATLLMNMSKTNAGAFDVGLHKVSADWGEGTSDAGGNEGGGTAATSGDATWIHSFFDTTSWTTPGGDFTAAASATTSVGAVGDYSWQSAQMTADVTDWIENPSTNFGWIIIGDETPNTRTAKRFDSSEFGTNASRGIDGPVLQVDFEQTVAVGLSDAAVNQAPTVIGFALLLLGVSFVVIGRRSGTGLPQKV